LSCQKAPIFEEGLELPEIANLSGRHGAARKPVLSRIVVNIQILGTAIETQGKSTQLFFSAFYLLKGSDQ